MGLTAEDSQFSINSTVSTVAVNVDRIFI